MEAKNEWEFYSKIENETRFVLCKLCKAKLSRGSDKSNTLEDSWRYIFLVICGQYLIFYGFRSCLPDNSEKSRSWTDWFLI